MSEAERGGEDRRGSVVGTPRGGTAPAGWEHDDANPLPGRVDLVEVGLRDGLQNQSRTLATADKLLLLDGLVAAGIREIQLTSFVHPDRVPQMADAEALCEAVLDGQERPASADGGSGGRFADVAFSGLALNLRGVQRLAAAGLQRVDLSLSASDSHGRRNAGMSREAAERHLLDAVAAAHDLGLSVRGGMQCAFGCGGEVADDAYLDEVVRLSASIAAAGVTELALADSAGLATPLDVERLLRRVRFEVGELPLVLHLHDTRGLALANFYVALRQGVTRFDTAFGGLGGCPFIPGATGNVATEDVVNLLDMLGVASGIDVDRVCSVSQAAESMLAVELPSTIYGLWRRTRAHREVVSA